MSEYNPFDKELDDLEPSDLLSLQSVTEGWYVEYKSQMPNAASIAKSISAFANTYGGWLFYGISEQSKENAVAGNFVGIAKEKMDSALQTIRQAVAVSINPAPHFDIKVVWGPMAQIGLASENGVICVRVPQGFASPYVHKSGMIYRRVGDGSEPKAEADRFILDQLWRRGDSIRNEYSDWLDSDLELSKGEGDRPYLRIFISPDLWRDKDIWAKLNTDKVRAILSKSIDAECLYAIPFDTVHRTASGYVGRQVKNNDPHSLTATWFLNPNLTSMLVLPLPTVSNDPISGVEYELQGYAHASQYSEALRQHGHGEATIVDLNFVFTALAGMFNIQSYLDAEAKRVGPLFIKAQFINVWRMRPFIDLERVVSHQLEHGVPVCLKSNFLIPTGKSPDTFQEIPTFDDVEKPSMRKFFQAMYAFDPIAAAMGIETGSAQILELNGAQQTIYSDLVETFERASAAQTFRNAKQNKRNNY